MHPKRLQYVAALAGLMAVTYAAAPANADTIQYTLTDGSGDVITFALPQFPTPVVSSGDWFAETTTVVLDGTSQTEDVTFYDDSFLGGLSIAATPYTDQILDQAGSELFSGSISNPKLLTESALALRCVGIHTGTPCSADTYDGAFTLTAIDIPRATPEPPSLALTLGGLGLLALLLTGWCKR
jgi:hypothetical protein